jgi:hypothetical protein
VLQPFRTTTKSQSLAPTIAMFFNPPLSHNSNVAKKTVPSQKPTQRHCSIELQTLSTFNLKNTQKHKKNNKN